jgi:CBS-domain-containing membrane protein
MVFSFVKSIIKIKKDFKRHWKDYIIQSLLATVISLIIFILLNLEGSVIIASLASTIFIVFALPKGKTAYPRNIFLGYAISMLVGSVCALIPHARTFYMLLIYSLAVGLSIFIMVIMNAKHPPAAGVALSFAMYGFHLNTFFALFLSSV